MKTVLFALAAVVVLAAAGGAVYFRMAPDDPALWHADPAEAARTGRPNDYLVAPPGTTRAVPDRSSPVHAMAPADLMFLFDAVARPAGARLIGGSVEAGFATYVQRSAVMGFPDYISVRAVAVEGGSALIVWSRSRYGHSDLGVNKARVEGWMQQIGG